MESTFEIYIPKQFSKVPETAKLILSLKHKAALCRPHVRVLL